MGAHLAGSIILIVFAILMGVVGALRFKTKGFSGIAQGIILGVASLALLGGIAWLFWAIEAS